MDLSLVVNLPNKPISHNATNVSNDGKSLTWNLATQQEDVELTFALYNLSNIFVCVLGVIVVVVGVVIVIAKSGKNKNGSNNQVINNEQNANMNNTNEVNNTNNEQNANMNNSNEVNNTNNEVREEIQPVTNNEVVNNGVNTIPNETVNNEQPTVNEQDDIFPDNQPNTEQNGDSSPLEDLFNNNPDNN